MSTSEPAGTGAVLEALADPTRRAVLDLVATRGPLTATALAAGLPVSRQAVMKHLDVLAAAHLVLARRRGREVHYEVRPGPLLDTGRWLSQRAAQWERRLTSVKRLAEQG